jgi:NADPH:quinone reductase-like Zn-dependent oxidoreductase
VLKFVTLAKKRKKRLKMKAIYQTSYKKSETCIYGDLPDPSAGTGQILISVKAVSVNPIDYKIKNGDLRLLIKSNFPKIVGSDYAGIVKEVGPDVADFKPGDRVYGAVPLFFGKQGALSELLSIDSKNARLIPQEMSFEEAASLPVAALTALNGLRKCGIKDGCSVLVNGATGGVGHFALQIAKAKGAIVTATCTDSNSTLAMELGAGQTVSYKRPMTASKEGGFDAILDAYGKMNYPQIIRLLKNGGTYASPLFMPPSVIPAFFARVLTGRKLTSSNMRKLPEDYAEIERLFTEKKLKPVIENRYPLEKASEAFEKAENGKPRGKVIVNI